jgi:hypothetical protein
MHALQLHSDLLTAPRIQTGACGGFVQDAGHFPPCGEKTRIGLLVARYSKIFPDKVPAIRFLHMAQCFGLGKTAERLDVTLPAAKDGRLLRRNAAYKARLEAGPDFPRHLIELVEAIGAGRIYGADVSNDDAFAPMRAGPEAGETFRIVTIGN